MTGAALALASAAAYGVSDFAGGLLARRIHFRTVALFGQIGGLVAALATAPLFPAALDTESLVWGAVSGVGTAFGMLFLFRGLSTGAMSVVVPVSAVGGVALPVLVGVLWLAERPSPLAWVGIVAAVPALWLVSHDRDAVSRSTSGTVDALIAGTGIAVQYLALAQADAAAGTWPVVSGRLAAIVTLVPLLHAATPTGRPSPLTIALSLMTGVLALISYLLAIREQLVVIAVVLSSLYPAIPVLLGITVLGERLVWQQTLGLAGATTAIALLALG
ncbi:EamA family transporter [Nocardia sp. NPDC023852]|uniref:EamA family transporter n=1 Tax=Nocardia sp. NPDC023852 TaxID=3154697 RepID=UPI0033D7712E